MHRTSSPSRVRSGQGRESKPGGTAGPGIELSFQSAQGSNSFSFMHAPTGTEKLNPNYIQPVESGYNVKDLFVCERGGFFAFNVRIGFKFPEDLLLSQLPGFVCGESNDF